MKCKHCDGKLEGGILGIGGRCYNPKCVDYYVDNMGMNGVEAFVKKYDRKPSRLPSKQEPQRPPDTEYIQSYDFNNSWEREKFKSDVKKDTGWDTDKGEYDSKSPCLSAGFVYDEHPKSISTKDSYVKEEWIPGMDAIIDNLKFTINRRLGVKVVKIQPNVYQRLDSFEPWRALYVSYLDEKTSTIETLSVRLTENHLTPVSNHDEIWSVSEYIISELEKELMLRKEVG